MKVIDGPFEIKGRGPVVTIDALPVELETGMTVRHGTRTWIVTGIETYAMPRRHTNGQPAGLLLRGQTSMPSIGMSLEIVAPKKSIIETRIYGYEPAPEVAPHACIVCATPAPPEPDAINADGSPRHLGWVYLANAKPLGALVCSADCLDMALKRHRANGHVDEASHLQALDFAYGNLAASTNHKPRLRAFLLIAFERGITSKRFNEWSKGKEWT